MGFANGLVLALGLGLMIGGVFQGLENIDKKDERS
jgi:hypothetical protein